MTALEELKTFAEVLDPFCQAAKVSFACLRAEHELPFGARLLTQPWLCLSQVSDELACGHIVSTTQGRNLFIRVRTPFAATETLKFVALRTYSMVAIQNRVDMPQPFFDRSLDPALAPKDLWQLLTQATDTLLRSPSPDQAFLQLEQSAPVPTKERAQVSYRATFCSGSIVGTVLPEATTKDAVQLQAAQLFLL